MRSLGFIILDNSFWKLTFNTFINTNATNVTTTKIILLVISNVISLYDDRKYIKQLYIINCMKASNLNNIVCVSFLLLHFFISLNNITFITYPLLATTKNNKKNLSLNTSKAPFPKLDELKLDEPKLDDPREDLKEDVPREDLKEGDLNELVISE